MLCFWSPRFYFYLITVSFFLLATSCTPASSVGHTATPLVVTPFESESNPLDDTSWELAAFESTELTLSIPDQPRLFLEFKNGQLSLEGGCNAVGGHYLVENKHIKITFASATLVDCTAEMPEIMQVEETFLKAMPTFESYTIANDELRIRYSEGEILFRRVSE